MHVLHDENPSLRVTIRLARHDRSMSSERRPSSERSQSIVKNMRIE